MMPKGQKVVVKKLKNTPPNWSHKTSEQKLEALAGMLDKAVLSYPHLIKRSFLAGIFTGLGATVGVTLVFLALAGIFRLLGGIPFLGDLIRDSDIGIQIQNLNPRKENN